MGLALLSAASFSAAGSFGRSLSAIGWSPVAAVTARVAGAAVVLAIPAAIAMRGRWHTLARSRALVVIYGLVAVAGGQVCFFNAIEHLSVGVALLLEYLGTILVVAWMWLRHGQKPRSLTLVGSVVALTGLGLVLDLTGDARLDVVGVLWALGGAIGLAGYFVMSGEDDSEVPPVALTAGGMIVGTAALFAVGGLGALPMHARFTAVEFAGHRVSWLVPVAGLSLVTAAIAYVAGIAATRRLGPRLASFVGLTEVLFAVLFAWLLLGELPTGLQLAGGALIIAGVALVRLDEGRPAEAESLAIQPAT